MASHTLDSAFWMRSYIAASSPCASRAKKVWIHAIGCILTRGQRAEPGGGYGSEYSDVPTHNLSSFPAG